MNSHAPKRQNGCASKLKYRDLPRKAAIRQNRPVYPARGKSQGVSLFPLHPNLRLNPKPPSSCLFKTHLQNTPPNHPIYSNHPTMQNQPIYLYYHQSHYPVPPPRTAQLRTLRTAQTTQAQVLLHVAVHEAQVPRRQRRRGRHRRGVEVLETSQRRSRAWAPRRVGLRAPDWSQ